MLASQSCIMLPAQKIKFDLSQQNMFHNLAPITGGVGMRLLQKMGWKPGQVLGKRGEGNLEPIAMSVKMDRKGLISCEESGKGGKGGKGGPRNVAVTPGVQGELFFDKIRIILIVIKKIIYLREYISLAGLLDLLFNHILFHFSTCVKKSLKIMETEVD